MRVLIMSDMEGVSGIVVWDQVNGGAPQRLVRGVEQLLGLLMNLPSYHERLARVSL